MHVSAMTFVLIIMLILVPTLSQATVFFDEDWEPPTNEGNWTRTDVQDGSITVRTALRIENSCRHSMVREATFSE